MNLLLIDLKPGWNVFERSLVSAPTYPSMSLAMLAGAAKSAGHPVQVLDLRVSGDSPEKITQTLVDFQPEVIGIGANTPAYPSLTQLVPLLRQGAPDALLIAGGIHPSALPEQTLADHRFDAVVLGEGEGPLVEILDGKPFESIEGLVFPSNGGVQTNSPATPIADLDDLPMPDYSPFRLDAYQNQEILWKSTRIIQCETSRGCPFQCSFCSSRWTFGGGWRPKSVSRVMTEIESLLSLGFQEIHFQDDGFTIDLDRAKEICRRIIGIGRPFPWELFNGIRVDRVDEEFLLLAKQAGCYRIRFGVESGDQKVLDAIGKGTTLARIRRTFELCRKADIETVALFMFGLPEETGKSHFLTIDLAREIHPDLARVSLFAPYPGSPIRDQWEAEGRIKSTDWSDYHFHLADRLLFEHPTLPEAEILSAYKRFYRQFYFRPAYWLERLAIGIRRGTVVRDIRYFWSKFLRPRFLA
jgi:radical SAM superfamily enzyme YgiQ (UPF0313 family)